MSSTFNQSEQDLAIRCAWLSYVGGYTQAEIGKRMGISRVKVHRLIAAAHEAGAVKVFIEGEPAELIALEDAVARHFGLEMCSVVPAVGPGDGNPFVNVGTAAARFLRGRLDSGEVGVLGVGWGRTLAEMVLRLPQVACPALKVVPVLGSVTRKMALNPYDVVHRLSDATGAEGYILPVPLFADRAEHREILMSQRSVRDTYELACRADLTLVGVGAVPPYGHSLLMELGEISTAECEALYDQGAQAEVVGQFLGADGELIDCDVNRRTLCLSLEVLHGHHVVAVAAGEEKVQAVMALLKSGMLKGLITDEVVARRIARHLDLDAGEEATRQSLP